MAHNPRGNTSRILIPFFERLSAQSRQETFLDSIDREKLFHLVRGQLEELLNTRSSGANILEENNVADYGLQDFSYIDLNSELQKRTLIKEIEQKILAYIPLIERVKVVLFESEKFNTLNLLIKALLSDASENRIEFQAVLEPKSRVLKVKEGYYHA